MSIVKLSPILTLAVSFFALLTHSAIASDSDAIKVGVIVPLSGDLAAYGTATVNGLKLAQQSDSPHKVEFIAEDNKSCGPSDAVPAAQKLLSIDKVDVLMTVCTGAAQCGSSDR